MSVPPASRATVCRWGVIAFLTLAFVGAGAGVTAAAADAGTSAMDLDDGYDEFDVDPDLTAEFTTAREEGETIEIVVQLEDVPVSSVPEAEADEVLEEHATETQRPLLELAEETDGVTVVSDFWVTNAVVLEVEAEQTDLGIFEDVDEVSELHGNIEIPAPDPPSPPGREKPPQNETEAGYETTYGLAQIGAPNVWEQYQTKGDGVTVAVLDTGIDADHPDLELHTENPNDPTYPGGWAEFDAHGEQIADSTPHDSGVHGTHVSGTVAGGDASGVHVGVAPDVELVHGKVMDQESGTYAQVLAGMEWAVESDADVLSMSFGAPGTYDRFITPVQNVEASGVVPVAAIGNEGHRSSDSPGNVYDAVAVGAVDEDESVASFSGGETLTSDDWSDAPTAWPDEYVVPDLVAPGVGVYSTVDDGGYGYSSGTSMATPHVTGTVALVLAVEDDLPPSDVGALLHESARNPAAPSSAKDERYGYGVIDAEAAVDAVASSSADEPTDDTEPSADEVEEPRAPDDATQDDVTVSTDGTPGFGVLTALVSVLTVVLWRVR